MAATQSTYLLLSNTALNVGDNVLDPGPLSPGPDGRMPTNIQLFIRVHSVVTGNVTPRLEYSYDGTNWGGGDPAQTMTAIAAAGSAAKSFACQWPRVRLVANLSAGSAAITAWIATN